MGNPTALAAVLDCRPKPPWAIVAVSLPFAGAQQNHTTWATSCGSRHCQRAQKIPAMYEVHGRKYLVVPAASAKTSARQISYGSKTRAANRAYVAFALPK
jgi:hypothetical protein